MTETSGYEAHLVFGYNMVFDPARSHVSVSLGYEAGRYDVTYRTPAPDLPADPSEFDGHVLWIRTGLHWHRPSYQLVPFASVPLAAGKRGEGPPVGNELLTFEVVYEKVLRTYHLLYPAMNQVFPLNDPKLVAKYAKSILEVTDPAMWMSIDYMPRTRDLSAKRRTLLQAWCRKVLGSA